MSLFQSKVESLLKKQELDKMVRLGIERLRSEGAGKDRLNKIIENEKKYQQIWLKSSPNAKLPAGTVACVLACEKLLSEVN